VLVDHFEVFVFDFDGTLVESNEIKLRAFYRVAEHLDGSRERISSIMSNNPHWTRVEIFDELTRNFFTKDERAQASERLLRAYSKRTIDEVAHASEVKGACELLEELSLKQKDIYISSATPLPDLVELTQRRSLSGFIKDCFGAPEDKREHLANIKELSDCGWKDMLCIGDGDGDEAAALACGCEFIRVKHFCETPASDPKRWIGDMKELRDLLFC